MSTEHGGFPGAYHVKQCTIRSQFIRMAPLCARARGGVHGTTYPTPPFLFDLAHLSCAVSGSLLELPPWWLCPLDGEGGGGGGWGGGEMAEMEGVLWGLLCEGGWDDRLGRPTPEHFHKSRVSKQASVCGKPRNPEECTPSTGREGVLQASVGVKGCRGTILPLEGQNYGLC